MHSPLSIFIVDRSGSMMAQHCRPLAGTPVYGKIQAAQDNCYGAVLSALYGFWAARETAATHSGTVRRDAYSIILEGTAPEVRPLFQGGGLMLISRYFVDRTSKRLHHVGESAT